MYRFSHHRIFDGHFISVEYVYCDVSYYSHALLKVLILKPPLKLPCRTYSTSTTTSIYIRSSTYVRGGGTDGRQQTRLPCPRLSFFPALIFLPSVLVRRQNDVAGCWLRCTLQQHWKMSIACHNGSHFIITRGRLCFFPQFVERDLQKRHFCTLRSSRPFL